MWLVARYEYLRTTRRRSFLLGMLAIPAVLGVIILAGVLVSGTVDPLDSAGYVDGSGILEPPAGRAGESLPRRFADEAAARRALEQGEIQTYYLIPPDYLATRQVSIKFLGDPPSDKLQNDFDGFIRDSITSGLPDEVRTRLRDGFDVTLRTASGRTMNSSGFANLILPGLVGFLFMFAVLTTGGYLMQAVADERENRTVEVLATSLTPEQLIVGKAIGLVAAALTQLAVWSITVTAALVVAARYVEFLARLTPPVSLMVVAMVFFLPSFALVSGVMTLVGSVVGDSRQGQQLSAIINMFFVLPLFFLTIMMESPDGILAVALTLFPTTSMVTVAMRWGVTDVPIWQLGLAFALVSAAAGAAVWAAPRVFRTGMLRYGQRLAPRHLFGGLRSGGR
ncbi:MAG TPA: ABC transporter permease [Thermoleophilia bacterium]|nr:ABC transporter permease [Thermoleophilia bacterium]